MGFTFTDLMQDEQRDARMVLGNALLVWNSTTQEWIVYQHKHGAKQTTEVTYSRECDAIRALILTQENC